VSGPSGSTPLEDAQAVATTAAAAVMANEIGDRMLPPGGIYESKSMAIAQSSVILSGSPTRYTLRRPVQVNHLWAIAAHHLVPARALVCYLVRAPLSDCPRAPGCPGISTRLAGLGGAPPAPTLCTCAPPRDAQASSPPHAIHPPPRIRQRSGGTAPGCAQAPADRSAQHGASSVPR